MFKSTMTLAYIYMKRAFLRLTELNSKDISYTLHSLVFRVRETDQENK